MNLMGYDAMAIGEGDLGQLGVDAIRGRIAEATFPCLSANAYLTEGDELLAQPYVILPRGERQIAVIGLTGPAEIPGIEIRDPIASVREVVAQIGEQADILILLSHTGLDTNKQIAQQIPELNLIVSGGGRTYTRTPASVENGPPVVHADVSSPGHAGRKIGTGVWSFDADGELEKRHWRIVELNPDIPDDPELSDWSY